VRHLIASKKAASGRAAAVLAVRDGAAFNIAHAARITRAPTKLGLTSAHSWGTANREMGERATLIRRSFHDGELPRWTRRRTKQYGSFRAEVLTAGLR